MGVPGVPVILFCVGSHSRYRLSDETSHGPPAPALPAAVAGVSLPAARFDGRSNAAGILVLVLGQLVVASEPCVFLCSYGDEHINHCPLTHRFALCYGSSVAAPHRSFEPTLEDFADLLWGSAYLPDGLRETRKP